MIISMIRPRLSILVLALSYPEKCQKAYNKPGVIKCRPILYTEGKLKCDIPFLKISKLHLIPCVSHIYYNILKPDAFMYLHVCLHYWTLSLLRVRHNLIYLYLMRALHSTRQCMLVERE